jgi:hypothetical protein
VPPPTQKQNPEDRRETPNGNRAEPEARKNGENILSKVDSPDSIGQRISRKQKKARADQKENSTSEP